jgi:hypothetical protein
MKRARVQTGHHTKAHRVLQKGQVGELQQRAVAGGGAGRGTLVDGRAVGSRRVVGEITPRQVDQSTGIYLSMPGKCLGVRPH